MTDSLQHFMSGIIDFAGLFPPAKLPLNKAITNYSRYKKSDDAWMLSHFVIPASKLQEVSKYGDELFTDDNPFTFSVLGSKTETIEGFEEEINTVINLCTAFNEKHPHRVATDVMEVKLPHEAARSQDTDTLKQLFDNTAEQLQSSPLAPTTIFYEGLMDEYWKKNNEAVIRAIADHNHTFSGDKDYRTAAYKIRCGGVKKELFPTVEQVAFILNCTRRNGTPLKGTAGLHHPVRHYADEVNTKMHGFFNVFGGGLLAHTNDFDHATLQEVLKEEDPKAFSFTDDKFSWNEYSITTNEIKRLRNELLLSYGSCSFDEPKEDLQELHLM